MRFHGHLLRIDDDAWPKKATMHYVDGRQPKGQPRKRLCDVICVDMKSLNLSNEDPNKRTVWSRAIKRKKINTTSLNGWFCKVRTNFAPLRPFH